MILKIEKEITYETDFSKLFIEIENLFKDAFAKVMKDFFDNKFLSINLDLKASIKDGCIIYIIGDIGIIIYSKYTNRIFKDKEKIKSKKITKTVLCDIHKKVNDIDFCVTNYSSIIKCFNRNNNRERLWQKLQEWLLKNSNEYKKLINISKL